MSEEQSMSDERNIIKLRGLPWNSTVKDILEFLKECQALDGEKSVHLAISHRDGRPNGEAFVELATPEDVDKAFEYNKNVLGHRYIEIFNAKTEEFEQCLRRQNLVQQDTFIKLRGLPFSCKAQEIEQFFEGLEIRNGSLGIYIVYDSRGRPTGEAFVQFCNSEDTDLAMKKNREKIGHRYIEIFRSSSSECRRSTIFNNISRSNGGSSGGGGGGGIGFNNDRMGRGQRNNRTNFRDRPYPDTPWSSNNNSNSNNNNDAPWRNNNRGNFGGNNSFGGNNGNSSSNNNNFNDNFDGGNMFNNDNNFSSDFERNWNSGGGNSYNNFGGSGSGGGGNSNNNNSKGNMSSFDRDFGGFNSFSNNSNSSNSGHGNFGNDRFMNNGGDGGRNMNNSSGGQYAVHLRGMPYDCGEEEVQQFFSPLQLVGVQVLYNNNGRHTGEADAYFSTIADAQEAMKKHKEKMGSRYIELFAKSNERPRGGGNSGGRF